MSAMPSPIQSEFTAGLPIRGPMEGSLNPDLEDDPFIEQHQERLMRKNSSSRLASLVMFLIGVGVTVAWYSFGDPVREAIAAMSPQLAWMAPAPAPAVAAPVADATAPATTSLDQQISAQSQDIDAVRQNVDRIATAQDQIIHSIGQLATGQEQLTKEIAKLQAVEQYILYKNSEPPAPRSTPAPAPVRRPAGPMSVTPPLASQPAAAH